MNATGAMVKVSVAARLRCATATMIRGALLLLLAAYRVVLSPLLTTVSAPFGFGCRFSPTCSVYAMEAIRRHGAGKGAWLTLRRLGRCHPWGGSGSDPVPETTCRH